MISPFLRSILVVAIAAVCVPASTAFAQDTNAPVAPDTIYVGRAGGSPGLSVIDLNGFGASTGDPSFDPTFQHILEGDSNYPNNPNVRLQGSLLRPPLAPGTTTLNGGSAGVFTLTRNSALDNLLLRSPSVLSIDDMMLGHPLDTSFNDSPAPFGCQAGGGNLCAISGKQVVAVVQGGPNTLAPLGLTGVPWNVVVGGGNPISFAPHPNPPPLIDPPLCLVPHLRGQEPTSIESIDQLGLSNLLVPGDPFGNPGAGIPPTGLLSIEQNNFFFGPSLPQLTIAACESFEYRQQIGHWLYIADRARGEIVVANSNTLRVLRRIPIPDPTELAMGPNLDLLAVTSQATNQVWFIDIDPASATFNQPILATTVGIAPRGIAWDPGNEDVLVCNEGGDSVSILSAATLQVRKVVHRGLHEPFAIAVTQRQSTFGFQRNVYFAYILDRAGRVSLFESGPNGVNGWGFDDIIGQTSFTFANPHAIQPDPLRLQSGVWIAHEGQLAANGSPTGLAGGALSNLVIDSSTFGAIPLNALEKPNLRGLSFRIARSVGSDQLSGVPYDIAFDDQRNLGALTNFTSVFGPGAAAPINGKSLVRMPGSGPVVNTNEATYLFAAMRNGGVVDVVRLSNGLRVDVNAHQPGVQSIAAPGATLVMDYFRE